MNNYSVDDVSRLLKVNKETVRRWIRNGELNATGSSKKNGKSIDEKELITFLKKTPKYMSFAIANLSTTLALNPGLAIGTILLGGVGAGIISLILDKDAEPKEEINKDDIKKLMEKNKSESEKMIQKKTKEIEKLQKELMEEQNKLSNINSTLLEMGGEINE